MKKPTILQEIGYILLAIFFVLVGFITSCM
jgi:hypothetical protein